MTLKHRGKNNPAKKEKKLYGNWADKNELTNKNQNKEQLSTSDLKFLQFPE